jgi:hypothetical protein
MQLFTQGWLGGLIAGTAGVVLGAVGLEQARGEPVGLAVYAMVFLVGVGCCALSVHSI